MVYLTDTRPEDGAFCVVPAIYAHLDAWLAEGHPAARRRLDTVHSELVAVPGRAGDLVLWDARMPHGNLANGGDRLRVTFYVSMFPPGVCGDRAEDHIALWRECRVNPHWADQPDHDHAETWPPATLTALGRRLIGLNDY